jgi:hypothetical protein
MPCWWCCGRRMIARQARDLPDGYGDPKERFARGEIDMAELFKRNAGLSMRRSLAAEFAAARRPAGTGNTQREAIAPRE